MRPLLNVIRSKGCTYRWGYPFHLIVRKGAQSFAFQHVENLPQLFESLETDPVAVPDWLAPVPPPAATEATEDLVQGIASTQKC